MDLFSHPHRRYNPLTGEWVLVSPQRTDRPWLGLVEPPVPETRPAYDPNCYLCPGNERAGGARNPLYEGTFVFENDFAALSPDTPKGEYEERGLLRVTAERGVCRVICFSSRHNWALTDMSVEDVRRVVDAWAEQTDELSALDGIGYVQLFENNGAAMGASNPHPHCQVWGTEHVPNEPAKELRMLAAYRAEHGSCLLCDYLALELAAGERIVLQNDSFVALVPFWAIWPFETMVLPRRHLDSLVDPTASERDALADLIKRLTALYDSLFGVSFPYSMGFHQSPVDRGTHGELHLHAHYYPPLLRSATVRKFMVGFEMLGMPQRDLTPEADARRLRDARMEP